MIQKMMLMRTNALDNADADAKIRNMEGVDD